MIGKIRIPGKLMSVLLLAWGACYGCAQSPQTSPMKVMRATLAPPVEHQESDLGAAEEQEKTGTIDPKAKPASVPQPAPPAPVTGLPPPFEPKERVKLFVPEQPPVLPQPTLPPGTMKLFEPLPKPEMVDATPAPAPVQTVVEQPLGFAGKSRVRPRDAQLDDRYIPVEDRWRIGFPNWDRYGKGFPPLDDYPYVRNDRWWDPFKQNVLKADYPIYGQNIFLEVTAATQAIFELRQTPIPTTPFESTRAPNQIDFFGNPNQQFYTQNFFLSFDLFCGDAAFRPIDWRIKVTGAFNMNNLIVEELAVVSPDVTSGTTRFRTWTTLQEYFVEAKIADLGPDYDFISVRAGSQPFTSDFRGFIFSDMNRAVRIFGTRFSNRDQFNLVYFYQAEKDTNSGLNTFKNRNQQIVIANYYRQDFIFPGYTSQWSVHFNHDEPTFKFDNNGFLVRPDPVGVFQPHQIDVAYLGWTGDGHINRLNINHAFYWALGHDTLNPLANAPQTINAQMAALEISLDFDWIRFRSSFFWASGDRNVNNGHATGFDTILDNPNFAGGDFSYWQRQTIRLFGVNLTQRQSLIPDLRSSKIQGQANFVNPGLYLGNFGFDVEATPRLRFINNANVLWFDSLHPLQQFVYQGQMNKFIGVDLSTGFEYRPLLSNNAILRGGISSLLPGSGTRNLFDRFDGKIDPQLAGFLEAVLLY